MRFPDFDDECRKLEWMREKMDLTHDDIKQLTDVHHRHFDERYPIPNLALKPIKYPNKNGVPDYVIKCYLELRPDLIETASIDPSSGLEAVLDMFTHIDHCMGMLDEHGNLVELGTVTFNRGRNHVP